MIYLETIYNALESRHCVDVIYTDYEKAFDNVDHGLLLMKLSNFGIHRKILKLIESYLTNRQQRVRVNGHFSGITKATSGVPQGSILSSLLFLVYINDLPSLCKTSLPLLCADDAKFIAINQQKLNLQLDLSRVKRWSDKHQLPLNVGKCSHLAFHANDVKLYFSGDEIRQVQTQKDLGIHMSNDMKWNQHIKTAAKKALGVFFMLKRSSPSLTPPTKMKLYKSMVLPVLIYGSTCWFANVENTKNLEGVQKKCLKWIYCTSNSNYKELLQQSQILPLSLYLQLQDLLLLSKMLRGYFEFDPTTFIHRREPSRTLRTSGDIQFEHGKRKLQLCEQSFFYRTTVLVNRLPKEVQFDEPVGLKKRLLKHLWYHFDKNYNEIVSSTWKI